MGRWQAPGSGRAGGGPVLVVCAPAVVLLLLLCGRALGLTVLAGFLLAYALHLAGSPEGALVAWCLASPASIGVLLVRLWTVFASRAWSGVFLLTTAGLFAALLAVWVLVASFPLLDTEIGPGVRHATWRVVSTTLPVAAAYLNAWALAPAAASSGAALPPSLWLCLCLCSHMLLCAEHVYGGAPSRPSAGSVFTASRVATLHTWHAIAAPAFIHIIGCLADTGLSWGAVMDAAALAAVPLLLAWGLALTGARLSLAPLSRGGSGAAVAGLHTAGAIAATVVAAVTVVRVALPALAPAASLPYWLVATTLLAVAASGAALALLPARGNFASRVVRATLAAIGAGSAAALLGLPWALWLAVAAAAACASSVGPKHRLMAYVVAALTGVLLVSWCCHHAYGFLIFQVASPDAPLPFASLPLAGVTWLIVATALAALAAPAMVMLLPARAGHARTATRATGERSVAAATSGSATGTQAATGGGGAGDSAAGATPPHESGAVLVPGPTTAAARLATALAPSLYPPPPPPPPPHHSNSRSRGRGATSLVMGASGSTPAAGLAALLIAQALGITALEGLLYGETSLAGAAQEAAAGDEWAAAAVPSVYPAPLVLFTSVMGAAAAAWAASSGYIPARAARLVAVLYGAKLSALLPPPHAYGAVAGSWLGPWLNPAPGVAAWLLCAALLLPLSMLVTRDDRDSSSRSSSSSATSRWSARAADPSQAASWVLLAAATLLMLACGPPVTARVAVLVYGDGASQLQAARFVLGGTVVLWAAMVSLLVALRWRHSMLARRLSATLLLAALAFAAMQPGSSPGDLLAAVQALLSAGAGAGATARQQTSAQAAAAASRAAWQGGDGAGVGSGPAWATLGRGARAVDHVSVVAAWLWLAALSWPLLIAAAVAAAVSRGGRALSSAAASTRAQRRAAVTAVASALGTWRGLCGSSLLATVGVVVESLLLAAATKLSFTPRLATTSAVGFATLVCCDAATLTLLCCCGRLLWAAARDRVRRHGHATNAHTGAGTAPGRMTAAASRTAATLVSLARMHSLLVALCPATVAAVYFTHSQAGHGSTLFVRRQLEARALGVAMALGIHCAAHAGLAFVCRHLHQAPRVANVSAALAFASAVVLRVVCQDGAAAPAALLLSPLLLLWQPTAPGGASRHRMRTAGLASTGVAAPTHRGSTAASRYRAPLLGVCAVLLLDVLRWLLGANLSETLLPLKLATLRHMTPSATRAVPHMLRFAAAWQPKSLGTTALTLALVAAVLPSLRLAVRQLARSHAPPTVTDVLWVLPMAVVAAVAVTPWSGKTLAIVAGAASVGAVWEASQRKHEALRRL